MRSYSRAVASSARDSGVSVTFRIGRGMVRILARPVSRTKVVDLGCVVLARIGVPLFRKIIA